MQSTSALYNTILAGNHRKEIKVNIAGTDYGMDALTGVKITRSLFGNGSPELGLATAGEITLSLYADSAEVPRMAEIRPYVRLNDGAGQVSEWLPRGVFYTDTRSADASGLLTLTGYDAMLKAERTQPWSELVWPAADLAVVREIATILGVTVDSKTVSRMTGAFPIPMPVQYTMRETLKFIAALYGGSFTLTDRNTLLLVPLWSLGSTADVTVTGGMGRLSLSPAFPACTGVRFLIDDETEVFAGTESGYVYEISCPWGTQAAANRLRQRMSDFVYRPFSGEKVLLNPAAELGDTLSLTASGTTVLSGLFSCETDLDILCPANIRAPADEELDHEYKYESTSERKYRRKIKDVESELSLQAQAIAAKVSRTGGDASSFGWYLDADRFSLLSDGSEVLRADDDGLTLHGTIYADAGEIGGCSISNGVLQVSNANIGYLNASKITVGTLPVGRLASKSITGAKIADSTLSGAKIADQTLGSTKLADGAGVNRVIGDSAVSYGKTSFQNTLDQVGTNKANIDTISGYFTGYAHFSDLAVDGGFWFGGKTVGMSTVTISGRTLQYLAWQ